jgi:hypothetical protein
LPDPPSPNRSSMHSAAGHSRSASLHSQSHIPKVPENDVLDTSPTKSPSKLGDSTLTPPRTPDLQQGEAHHTAAIGPSTPEREPQDSRPHDDDDAHIEEPVIHSVQSVQSVQSIQPASPKVISKARLVDVPRRLPPSLPPRNPNRSGGPVVIDASPKGATADHASSTDALPVDAETEVKHDPAHEAVGDKQDDVDAVNDKMVDVRLDDDADDEDDEPVRANPWAKVEEARKEHEQHESEVQKDTAMPGSFQ